MKTKYLKDKDPWMLAEDIPDIDFQFSQIWLSSFVNDIGKACGRNYKKILCFYKGLNLKFYYGKKDSYQFADYLLRKILRNPEFGKRINRNIRIFSDRLKNESQKITPDYLRSLSNLELANLYDFLDKIHTELYIWGWLPNAVDMFHNNFTDYLKKIILKHSKNEEKINYYLVILSAFPERSILNKEHESFLKLARLKQEGKEKAFIKALDNHHFKYFYLKYLWVGEDGVYSKRDYLKEVNKFLKSGEKAGEVLHKEERILNQTLKEKREIIKRLKLNQKEIKLFDIYAEFAVTKLYRRDAQIYWAFKMHFLLKELSKRLKISLMEARFLFPEEISQGLEKGLSSSLRNDLKKRIKCFAYYAEKGVDLPLYGREVRELEKKVEVTSDKNIKEFSGQTACLGKARGKVRIINSVTEMKKMQKGDILVSIATNPDIVPAMKKAAAIITEQGGITSHAAIVSREMNTPCVIGTKIATKVLKDGNLVEVDANKGIIKILK